MRILAVVSSLVIWFSPSLFAQTLFVVGKVGKSSYGSAYIGNVGGGGGDQNWNPGPIVGLGMRVRTSDGFAVEGLVEYSIHTFANEFNWPIGNDPKNSIIELTATGHISFGIVGPVYFDLVGGIGVFSQHEDGIAFIYQNSQWTAPGKDIVNVGVVLGTGLEVRASKSIEFAIEANLRMRTYVTPVVQVGAAFAL